jgi:hypothetical protein
MAAAPKESHQEDIETAFAEGSLFVDARDGK